MLRCKTQRQSHLDTFVFMHAEVQLIHQHAYPFVTYKYKHSTIHFISITQGVKNTYLFTSYIQPTDYGCFFFHPTIGSTCSITSVASHPHSNPWYDQEISLSFLHQIIKWMLLSLTTLLFLLVSFLSLRFRPSLLQRLRTQISLV